MTCDERPQSRSFVVDLKSPSGEIGYVVTGAGPDDDAAVEQAVLLESPGTYGGLRRQNVKCSHQGGTLWHAVVSYALTERTEGGGGGPDGSDPIGTQTGEAPPENPPTPPGDGEPLGPEWQFDTSGQTVKIVQSKETRYSKNRTGGTAPNFDRAIGVTKDGVEGCDVYVPKFEYQVTYKFAGINRKYFQVLRDLTGTVNNTTFHGFNPREVLFLGASGQGGLSGWSVTYKFAVSPNKKAYEFSSTFALAADETKYGWDYAWCSYAQSTDASRLTQIPDCGYIERVYDTGDFSKLGIGT